MSGRVSFKRDAGKIGITIALFFLFPFFNASSSPRAGEEPKTDLMEMSLEELLSIKVVSVSKKSENLSETSAAVYVLSSEDIRRSGARNIPELLRQIPGMQVARISTSEWAISARGFASEFSNKLLVLIDGRSVYTPLFSGVYWEIQDLMLEDIDRIEVIRGPGATVWGANAVNGVINIITRNSRDTQGVMALAGGGDEENGFSAIRYGGEAGENVTYRAYGKYFDRDEFPADTDNGTWDGWSLGRGGFRIDQELSDGGTLMLSGEVFNGRHAQTVSTVALDPVGSQTSLEEGDISGESFLAKGTRPTGVSSSLDYQLYADRTDIFLFGGRELRTTADFELNHNLNVGALQQVSWGFGFRISDDEIEDGSDYFFDPSSRTDRLYSMFLQDNLRFADNRLRLTFGSKFEHNSYTGFEYQPSLRTSWSVGKRSSLWSAVSRAVRTPSRAEETFSTNVAALPGTPETGGLPVVVALAGTGGLESEDLLSLELGYRSQPFDRFAFDATVYRNHFGTIIGSVAGEPTVVSDGNVTYMTIINKVANTPGSDVTGVETSIEYDPADWWRFRAGYTYTDIRNRADGISSGDIDLNIYSQYPAHQVIASSRFDLPRKVELDLFASWVDELRESSVPAYTKLDIRAGWVPTEHLELSVAVLDVLDESHLEFEPWASSSKEISRRYYAKLTWTY